MTCEICNCPPYYNKQALIELSEDICANCVGTVPSGTSTDDFCIYAFNNDPSVCCDFLYVIEGENIWWSDDLCQNWSFYGSTTSSEIVLLPELFYEEVLVAPGYFTIPAIPQTYEEIYIELIAIGALVGSTSNFIRIMFNGDSTHANYFGSWEHSATDAVYISEGSYPMIISYSPPNTETSASETKIRIKDYASVTKNKTAYCSCDYRAAGSTLSGNSRGHQTWNDISGITDIVLSATTQTNPTVVSNFVTNSRIKVWLKKRVNVLISD